MGRLRELVNCINSSSICIQPHNYPDQDALASAYGLYQLLTGYGITAKICYEGVFDKVNTVAMVDLCQIPAKPVFSPCLNREEKVILVDGQYGNGNMGDLGGIPIACIDHHKKQEQVPYLFSDIRQAGACSSLVAEYFMESGRIPEKQVATALLYGIKVDTANLNRGVTELDINMFVYLYKHADMQLLQRIDSSTLKIEDLTAYQKAIASLQVVGEFGAADAGDECSEAMIGTLSDFLISLAGLRFTLVYSYRVGGLKLSVRSTNPEWDANKIIKEAIGEEGSGGGHAAMAAGFLPNIIKTKVQEKIQEIRVRILSCLTS